jgi:hypothetical protein
MNRRNLLTSAAASVMLPGAVKAEGISITVMPSPHPDADLLALVERFLAHEQTIQAMPCNAVPGTPAAVQEESEQRQIFGVKHALIMQLGDLRATTQTALSPWMTQTPTPAGCFGI